MINKASRYVSFYALLIVYVLPTLVTNENTPCETVETEMVLPLLSITLGVTVILHGELKTTSPPTSEERDIGDTTFLLSTEAETRKAPYVLRVVNEAAPSTVAFQTGKKRMMPPCD